ncbi:hypothetical protein N7468_002085 [Penicillium chermesinum]|uniref:Swi5-dependent recombination DNA repair protein 1 n=1 Tax=Penicillium chermesinum TaxID=63820 RepID=A0A9W9TXN0_9EURO|nr:uncharacterized protein N7468_002085 [Penicillium chermesinum]KAJ5247102.1 hypothetical protein N7468_002085 [Penicillium chermesinum]KAJ6145349.1 hypothetical protein N7470_009244 [Penicillium chermesinum]
MANEQPSKKQRYLNAAATLAMPFKSPLKRSPSEAALRIPSLTSDPSAPAQPGVSHAYSIMKESAQGDQEISLSSNPKLQPRLVRLRLGGPARTSLADAERSALEKRERSLQAQLKSLDEELDRIQQAIQIESSGKDVELKALTIKWRLVAQEAADELFTGAKERVARMGGITAWRERNQGQSAQWGFDDEAQGRGSVGEDPISEDNGTVQLREGQDEEFTMQAMLKMLNVDPKLIGIDPSTGSWVREE